MQHCGPFKLAEDLMLKIIVLQKKWLSYEKKGKDGYSIQEVERKILAY